MHPEIMKFWEDAGYIVNDITGPTFIMYWVKKNDTDVLGCHVATIRSYSSEKKYYLKYIEYTEAEMLRIIKLKSFL